jgi:hypothetical protein
MDCRAELEAKLAVYAGALEKAKKYVDQSYWTGQLPDILGEALATLPPASARMLAIERAAVAETEAEDKATKAWKTYSHIPPSAAAGDYSKVLGPAYASDAALLEAREARRKAVRGKEE